MRTMIALILAVASTPVYADPIAMDGVTVEAVVSRFKVGWQETIIRVVNTTDKPVKRVGVACTHFNGAGVPIGTDEASGSNILPGMTVAVQALEEISGVASTVCRPTTISR